ncbi:uncharacterized protein LOC133178802 [Saccostrea echinata]|uniref:uncharacterized protein LOC133178802 n=1 Tax=Saccostrea echinata TaxID=191078 RepID=UPI002A82FD9F|nr:uncharacterized protein LOC133178802 [Saccostrea echinata]
MEIEAPITLFYFAVFMQMLVTYTIDTTTLDSEFCGISKVTKRVVDLCPTDKESWSRAAKQFNCSQFEGKCTQTLEYHCLINPWQNVTAEVCAPPTRIRSGHCAEYNARGGKIQEFYIPNCESCARDYMSTEAYKYQECYDLVYRQKENLQQRKGNKAETHQRTLNKQQETRFRPSAESFGDSSDGSRVRSSRGIYLRVFFLCLMIVLKSGALLS